MWSSETESNGPTQIVDAKKVLVTLNRPFSPLSQPLSPLSPPSPFFPFLLICPQEDALSILNYDVSKMVAQLMATGKAATAGSVWIL